MDTASETATTDVNQPRAPLEPVFHHVLRLESAYFIPHPPNELAVASLVRSALDFG
jgi:hypothetical protein